MCATEKGDGNFICSPLVQWRVAGMTMLCMVFFFTDCPICYRCLCAVLVHVPPAQRNCWMLMTVYKPVTLRALYQSNVAHSASLATCPTPSVSESISQKATGASCHSERSIRMALGCVFRTFFLQIEFLVLTDSFGVCLEKYHQQAKVLTS